MIRYKVPSRFPKTGSGRVVWLGVIMVVLYWILESVTETFILDLGNFSDHFFFPDRHELWMRLFVVFLLLSFSIYTQFIINRHKQADERSARFGRIFEKSLNEIYLFDTDTLKFIQVNNAAQQNLGYTMAELRELTPLDIKPEFTPDSFAKLIKPLYNGKKEKIVFETVHKRKDQSLYDVEVHLQFLQYEKKALFAAIILDITERKQTERELKKYQQQLEKLVEERTAKLQEINKELESFAYSVSHDLRAPLRAIDGFTRILMEDYVVKLDAEGKRLGGVIRQSTQEMGKLIDGLLNFSRLGRSTMHISGIDMTNMVDAIYHEATTPQERKRITLAIDDLPKAQGDPNMMRLVWMNLITNALKFTSQRDKAVISVSYTVGENKLIYSVKDNGAGFDMKYKDKLFGVFQRLHSEREFRGTGVGLALVQRIIHRHGGEVWAEGRVNEGAVFYFSLPEKV